MSQEIWKPVNVMGGILADDYEVSNFGNVRSYIKNRWGKRGEAKVLKPSNPERDSYRTVHLRISKGKYRTFTIHKLVASAFLPNPNGYKWINHKDGNKKNNILSNLEWCSPSQNMKHALSIGKISKGRIRNLDTGIEYESVAEASRLERKSRGYITNRLRGHKDIKNLKKETIKYEYIIQHRQSDRGFLQ